MTRKWVTILACVLLLLLGALAYQAYRGFVDVEFGENVARVDWLPRSASNVSFYRSYGWTAYEFDISEQEFLKWAEQWPVTRLSGRSGSVGRYLSRKLPRPAASTTRDSTGADALDRYREATQKRISHGYFYDQRDASGGGVTVGYDSDSGRAYFQSQPR